MPSFFTKIHAVAPVLASGLLVGCAGSVPAAGTTPADEAKSEIAELRALSTAQANRLGELESRLALIEVEARSERRIKPRDTVVISGDNRRRRREANEARSAPVKLVLRGQRATNALPPLSTGQLPGLGVVPLPGQAAAATPTKAASAKHEYRAALALLRERDYAGAVIALDVFAQRFPGHALVANAVYWKGEAQYAKRSYRDALNTFNSVVERFAKSAKRSDALLKAGLCHRRLGDEELARALFRRVRQEFPKSDAARVASGEGAS